MGKLWDKIYNLIEKIIDKLDKFDEKKQVLRLKNENRKLEIRKRKYEIKEIKIQYNGFYKRLSKLTTHKILMYFIFINCSIVEIYSMRSMIILADLSALPTLMASVITESISYAIYCAKSYSGTKQEKIQELDEKKFELEKEIAKYEMDNNIDLTDKFDVDDGSVG